jgi:hypothetical protein
LRENIQMLFGEFAAKSANASWALPICFYDGSCWARKESDYAGEWRDSLHHIMAG